jgi:transposase-like protein
MGERGVPVDHSTIYRWVQSTRLRSKSGCAGSGVSAINKLAGR